MAKTKAKSRKPKPARARRAAKKAAAPKTPEQVPTAAPEQTDAVPAEEAPPVQDPNPISGT